MERQEILNKCKEIELMKKKFKKEKAKLIKKFPEANMGLHLFANLEDTPIFIKRYGNKIEFYQPKDILLNSEDSNINIRCMKQSLFGWSSSSCNPLSLKEFTNLIQIDEDYIKQNISNEKKRYSDGLSKLQKEILQKLNSQNKPKTK